MKNRPEMSVWADQAKRHRVDRALSTVCLVVIVAVSAAVLGWVWGRG